MRAALSSASASFARAALREFAEELKSRPEAGAGVHNDDLEGDGNEKTISPVA